jgi:Mg-chelatase subunit ChlD
MTLGDPFWLVLAIPLAMSIWWWRLRVPGHPLAGRGWRPILVLRSATLILVLLALCKLSVRLSVHSGTTILVMDRSFSMPEDSAAAQKEAADIVHAAMPAGDRLGVVSFGETAAVEQAPQSSKFAGCTAEVGREASQLADALDLAVSLVPPAGHPAQRGSTGRILVLSDGRWTGRDISGAAARAAAAGVAIDYRLMERPRAGDLAVESLQGPESVLPGESFMITAWIDSPLKDTVSYELRRGTQMISRGTQAVPAGTSRLVFRDTAAAQGVAEYTLHVTGNGADPVPENNTARLLVGVRAAKPLLCVTPSGRGAGHPAQRGSAAGAGLSTLLAKGGVKVKAIPSSQCNWTLEELAGCSGVLLENTPASLVGHVGMENLATWVTHSGGGLMITGGRDSYGPGGYYKSPLEPIMPVSMEMRREHRKLSVAIVVALDRSGSMAMPAEGGRAKIDLADLATAEVIEMLGTKDQFGCIAVDTIPHTIVPLSDVTDKAAMRAPVLRIDSSGGGIYVYVALAEAARIIAPAKAGTKHIILFSDAADAEEPGDYKTLVAKCAKAGITISVVGLGTEKDCDAELLKDIARRGGGQCMFTNIAQELPRLFAQDTFLIARSAFLEDPVAVRSTGGLSAITRQALGEFPKIGGYNLCYLQPSANLAVVSNDENHAPVLAAWQAGLGRVLCYTGEADGKYTGAIAGWKNVGEFFTSLARWTAGKPGELGRGAVPTQEMRNGVCRVELHLDPARQTNPFTSLPSLTTLFARPGETAVAKSTVMQWSSADTLLGEISLNGSQTALPTIDAPGLGQATLTPTCLPYSPEYRPPDAHEGARTLERLAQATGGVERLNLAGVWKDIPRQPRFISTAPYLLLAAVVLFLLEVIERRTGLFSAFWRGTRAAGRLRLPRLLPRALLQPFASRPAATDGGPGMGPVASKVSAASKGSVQTAAASTDLSAKASTKPAPEPKKEPADAGMLDALAHAQQRARKRTERK